jgi:hypothetical protein
MFFACATRRPVSDGALCFSVAGGTFGFGIGLTLVAVGGILALVGGGLIVAKKA